MGWFFLPRVFTALLTVVVVMVLTRVLAPEDFGLYNISIVSGTVAFSLLGGWLGAASIRFHAARGLQAPAMPQIYAAGLVTASVVLPLVTGLALLVFDDHRLLILAVAFFTLSHGIHEIALISLRVHRRGPHFALVSLARPAVGVSLAVLFVGAGGGYAAALSGMSLGALLVGTPALLRLARRSGLQRPRRADLAQFARFGLPLATVSARPMLTMLITQHALGWQVGLAAVGYFAAAQTIASRMVGMPMNSLTRAVSPSVFSAFERHDAGAMRRTLDGYVSHMMFICVPLGALLILSPAIVPTALFAPGFTAQVTPLLPVLTLAALLNGVQGGYLSFPFAIAKRTGLQMTIMLLSLVVHVCATWILVTAMGTKGAIWGMLASAVFGVSAYWIVGNRLHAIPAPRAEFLKGALGLAVLYPFAILAQSGRGPLETIEMLALGFAVFFAVMLALRQIAALDVLAALLRLWRRRRPL